MFDVKGSCAFASLEDLYLLIGMFNSVITPVYVEALNPTSTTQVGDLKRIPMVIPESSVRSEIQVKVIANINISKNEWDSFEFSWDFKRHPLITFSTATG